LDINEIKNIIPHRDPFLFIDEITELEAGVKAVGIKQIKKDEYFLKGHFPDYPVVPGVIIVEALAQVGAVAILSLKENKGKLVFFAGVDKFRFKKQVLPGDKLRLEVQIIKSKRSIGKSNAVAYVDDKIVALGGLMFAVSETTKRAIG
jgi:3-hydroxyacyl-[acyl-carrier-protein] dehydratase